MKFKLSRILFVIFVSFSVLFFQNCKTSLIPKEKSSDYKKLSSENSGGGNGEPYGGKLTYFAFAEGHFCLGAAGEKIPAEVARISEKSSKFILEFDQCKDQSIEINSSDISRPQGLSGVILFQGKGFIKQEVLPNLKNHDFVFPIATCRETVQGMHQRSGGIPLPLLEGESRIENHIEVDLVTNWYGDRKAKVVSIDETKLYHAPNSVPIAVPPKLVWQRDFFPLDYEFLNNSFHWWNSHFDYNATVNPGSSESRYILGSLAIEDNSLGSIESELSCVKISNE